MGISGRNELLMSRLRESGDAEDSAIDLAGTALILAALDRPDIEVEPYQDHLADLAARAARELHAADSVEVQMSRLNAVLVEEFRYRGDVATYDDLRNANLMDVIDRRLGLPVALGILYLHVAKAYGAEMTGLDFPAHFLLRLHARGQRIIIDPFHGGMAVSPPDLRRRLKEILGPEAEIAPSHYRTVGNRDILIRLQNNIKVRAVANGDLHLAVAVLDRLSALAPSRADFYWESAVLHARLGRLRTAITTLESCLADPRVADGHDKIEDFLRQLQGTVH